ncbi:flippase [candidate division WOR-3 bacterium]|nr:flippase [candidate division WOR-3 bacterium]
MLVPIRQSENDFIKKSSQAFSSRVISFILGFGISIIIARALGPSGKGAFAFIMLIPALLTMLGNLGIGAANTYFTANRKYPGENIVSNTFFSAIVIGGLLILAFYLGSHIPVFKEFIASKHVPLSLLWLAISIIPFSLLYSYSISILVGREKIATFSIINIINPALYLLFIVFFVTIFKKSVSGAVTAYVLNIILIALITFFLIQKIGKLKLNIDTKLLRESTSYGFKAWVGNLAQFLNYRLDMFLVAYFLNFTVLGYYSLAVGIVEQLWLVPASIATVLFPRVSYIGGTKASRLTPKVTRTSLFIILVISFMLAIIAKPLIKFIYGKAFLPSVLPFLILLPGVIILSIDKVLSSDLAGRGKPEIGAMASLVSLLVNIPLNLLLIPRWGISGAAFASTIAYATSTIFMLAVFLKISGNSCKDTLLIKISDFRICFDLLSKYLKKRKI